MELSKSELVARFAPVVTDASDVAGIADSSTIVRIEDVENEGP